MLVKQMQIDYITPRLDRIQRISKIEKEKRYRKQNIIIKKKNDDKGFEEIFEKETSKYKNNDEKSK